MSRTMILVLVLGLAAGGAFGLTLSVSVPDDLWPFWQRLVSSSPLPDGTQCQRIEPGSPAGDDTAALELAPAAPAASGKIVGAMPLVPVFRLGDESSPVSAADVRAGRVTLLPLSRVELPDLAAPVDGLFPDSPGYPFREAIVLQLHTHDTQLEDWYARLPESPLDAAVTAGKLFWIGAVGDVMPGRGVDSVLLAPNGLERVFGTTLSVLRGVDFLMGNLESSAASGGTPEHKSFTFRFRSEALRALKDAGFAYLSLTNNHSYDYGTEGFLQTLDAFARWGIATSGAGQDLAQASQPSVVSVNGMEIRILSFGAYPVERTGFDGRVVARAGPSKPGILWLDEDGLAAASRAFSPSALNVAIVHGGREWSTQVTPEQRRLYRELVHHGANVVIGAHPHVLQEIEAYEGGLIAYSLGNFLFPGMEGTAGGEDSIVLELGVFDGHVRALRKIPVRLSGGTVRVAPDERAPIRER